MKQVLSKSQFWLVTKFSFIPQRLLCAGACFKFIDEFTHNLFELDFVKDRNKFSMPKIIFSKICKHVKKLHS